jgi:hypothetical protein
LEKFEGDFKLLNDAEKDAIEKTKEVGVRLDWGYQKMRHYFAKRGFAKDFFHNYFLYHKKIKQMREKNE